MSLFQGKIYPVSNGGGPFSYTVFKDGKAFKSVISVANISAALNGVRDDIGASLGSETVLSVTVTVPTEVTP